MKKITLVILTMAILMMMAAGCAVKTAGQKTDLKTLAAAEVRDYQGKNLSSILDFKDNSIKGPQYIDTKTYRLKIDGLVSNPKEMTYDEVTGHKAYKKVVTLHCIEGWSVDILWEGILLKDLFDEAKVKDNANTVIFYSYDGYSTSLPLDFILKANIIIADKMNGVTLPPECGYPFQLVAESKFGYKWAKWITHIELSDDASYEGYWESRGYSNQGDTYPFYTN